MQISDIIQNFGLDGWERGQMAKCRRNETVAGGYDFCSVSSGAIIHIKQTYNKHPLQQTFL